MFGGHDQYPDIYYQYFYDHEKTDQVKSADGKRVVCDSTSVEGVIRHVEI